MRSDQKSKYWNITKILPYQRNFNLINGERSIGKTFTCQDYILDRCIKYGEEFVYITRTAKEKESGALEDAFKKIVMKFYPEDIEYTTEIMTITEEEETEDIKRTLGYCIALSEAAKVKKKSYPRVRWLLFDEYMLEKKQNMQYVNGWREPDLLLSIYHTIDREEDRVICFLLGNNTSFFNPYHMHKAFDIPEVKRGEIWTSENVLFQWATGTEELKKDKEKSKFLRMLNGTSYGRYAKEGDYIDDNHNFIKPMSERTNYMFTVQCDENTFGVYSNYNEGVAYISDKFDPSCKITFALTVGDHQENTMLTDCKAFPQLKWLSNEFKKGNVRFVSMEVKTKAERMVNFLL